MAGTNTITVDLGGMSNTCFVVMPFDSLFQAQYERVIRPAVESVGLTCVRGDEIYSKPNIVADIWKSLRSARVVVAELTGKNPNVFYEIGLAHALGKPVILLTRREDDVPFDLRALRYRYYDPNDPFWGDHLREGLADMLRSTLEADGLAEYLEGIKLHTATPPAQLQPIERATPASQADISGLWQGAWHPTKAEGDDTTLAPYNGQLLVSQLNDRLSAKLTVTFERDGDVTVLQEDLTGSIDGFSVSLVAGSYTFIKKGNARGYFLDSFQLRADDNFTTLRGFCKDQERHRVVAGDSTFERKTWLTQP